VIFIKIDQNDLLSKIFSIFLIILSSVYVLLLIGLSSVIFLIFFLFTFSLVFFFFAFYPELRKFYFKIRTLWGERKTQKKNLITKFIENGGLIGYNPVCKEHIAIICPSESKNNYPSLEKEGLLLLINHYRDNNINYVLYFCYLSDDFIKIVKSSYVKGIHIFGHGRIDSLLFEDGVVQYRELRGTSVKDFIAQWHCNHGDGKSLGEYIGMQYYSPYGKRRAGQNIKDITKLIDNKLIWTSNEALS
jgi:hypothetical protein